MKVAYALVDVSPYGAGGETAVLVALDCSDLCLQVRRLALQPKAKPHSNSKPPPTRSTISATSPSRFAPTAAFPTRP